MFKVLIAEDEMLVRLGLKNAIDWNRYDMKVVADVPDGQTAWEVYLQEAPDIVITDLRMPVMDGMELISRIRAQDHKTQIVILSCLEEFDLIRKAMSLGVSHYILKLTMTPDEMEMVLRKVQAHAKSQMHSLKPALLDHLNRDALKENSLKNYLIYRVASQQEFTQMVSELELRLCPENIVLGLMEINPLIRRNADAEDGSRQFIKFPVLNALNEIMATHPNGEIFCESETRYILLFNSLTVKDLSCPDKEPSCPDEEIIGTLNRMVISMRSYFNLRVSFGLSSVQSGYSKLARMYAEAVSQLERRFFTGPGVYIKGNEYDEVHVHDTAKLVDERIAILLGLYAIIGFGKDFRHEYNEKVTRMALQLVESREKAQVAFHMLMQWILGTAFPLADGTVDIIAAMNAIDASETLDEMITVFRDFILDMNADLRRRKNVCPEIAKALKLVVQAYQNDISVQYVSEHVNLSPNYFSSLFKKEMHMNFTEYLNEYRVEEARKLLRDTYLKGYEISEKVGFNDNTYFTRVFKKVTGFSPGEYRKQWLKNWTEEHPNEGADKG